MLRKQTNRFGDIIWYERGGREGERGRGGERERGRREGGEGGRRGEKWHGEGIKG